MWRRIRPQTCDSGESALAASRSTTASKPRARRVSAPKVIAPGRRVALPVRGAFLQPLKRVVAPRGELSVAELGDGLPFVPKRYFVIADVPSGKVRGEHAHKRLQQFLVCLRGHVSVLVDDGRRRREVLLDSSDQGLYVPPMVWAAQYGYSRDAVLMVLASAPYLASDYLRDYDDFLARVRRAEARRAAAGGTP
jgi:UDP-2-acetamido-3-amino-2,3-dideoxy-glucuronate N-acetyltransferase